MFDVVLKGSCEDTRFKTFTNYSVYSIRDDGAGYPMFLLYADGQWIWKSAKFFEPISTKL